ncbi:MAG: hypothetical protein ACE5GN_06120, partial [Waddliaceae bacterium]
TSQSKLLDKKKIELISPRAIEKASALESSQITPEVKRIIHLSQKKLGAAKIAEKDGKIAFLSKDKVLEEYQKKGVEFILIDDIDDKGKLVKRTLKDRDIKHYSLSKEEHDRIFDAGLRALHNLSEQLQPRQEKDAGKEERGISLLQTAKDETQTEEKHRRVLEQKILSEIGKENQRKADAIEEEKIAEDHRKEERAKEKEEFLDKKVETPKKTIAGKEEVRKEDIKKVDPDPKPPRPEKKK